MIRDPAMRAFIEGWAIAGPELEAMRDAELHSVPLPVAMEQLAGMLESAIFLKPLTETSGLVEMQQIFARMRATHAVHE